MLHRGLPSSCVYGMHRSNDCWVPETSPRYLRGIKSTILDAVVDRMQNHVIYIAMTALRKYGLGSRKSNDQ